MCALCVCVERRNNAERERERERERMNLLSERNIKIMNFGELKSLGSYIIDAIAANAVIPTITQSFILEIIFN